MALTIWIFGINSCKAIYSMSLHMPLLGMPPKILHMKEEDFSLLTSAFRIMFSPGETTISSILISISCRVHLWHASVIHIYCIRLHVHPPMCILQIHGMTDKIEPQSEQKQESKRWA